MLAAFASLEAGASGMRRPRFIAEQARHAKGLVGRMVAFVMARETWRENMRAIDALDIRQSDRILDVGCGHGRSLGALAARAPRGHVSGIDPSRLMVEIALTRNAKQVRSGLVEIAVASADALPHPEAAFDKALCVHVLYFWKDLSAPFLEIARVLRPGGRVAIVFRSSANEAAVRAFPSDVYRFPALGEVVAALMSAGFTIADQHPAARRSDPILLMAVKLSCPR